MNGKPGDHPLTDLFDYGKCTLPEWMCELILQIHALDPDAFVEKIESLPSNWNEHRREHGDWFSWANGQRLNEAREFLENKLKAAQELKGNQEAAD